MPFTVSHIAAAVPLAKPLRRAGLFSAAVIGTMAPDMGLIWPLHSKLARADTHGFAALVTFALPLGFMMWVLFQTLVKPAVLEVLPSSWYAKIKRGDLAVGVGSPRQWLLAAFAILIGAVSHLLWDGVTHQDGMWVFLLPFLVNEGPSIAGHALYWFQILQHVSTVVGLVVVIWATYNWARAAHCETAADPRKLSRQERTIWLGAYLGIPFVLVLGGMGTIALDGTVGILSVEGLSYLAILGMSWSLISLLAVSALLRTRLSAFIASAHAT